MHTDLSDIFEDLSAEPRSKPQPRVFSTNSSMQHSRQDSTAAKRRSLPPHAIFARAAKGFSDIPDQTTANAQESHIYSSQRNAMTLDDLLTQPLFGKRQSTS